MVLEWREAFAVMPVNGENALVENALEDAGIYLKSERKKKKNRTEVLASIRAVSMHQKHLR